MINKNLLFVTGNVEVVFYSWIGTKGFDETKENEDLIAIVSRQILK